MYSATHDDNPVKPPKTRKPRALKAEKADVETETSPTTEKKPRKSRATKKDKEQYAPQEGNTNIGPLRKMYVMKFNTPILPFAKFPLTQNKYIQDFLKLYEEDKDKIEEIVGVHFP
jgi:hypothetical protein